METSWKYIPDNVINIRSIQPSDYTKFMYIHANRESSPRRAFITIPPVEVEETRQQYSQKIVSASGTFAFRFLHTVS